MAKKKDLVTQERVNAILNQAGYTPGRSAKAMTKDRRAAYRQAQRVSNLGKARNKEKVKALKEANKNPQIAGVNEKTSKYLNEQRRADADSVELGKPREEKKSWFNRTIDVISRGNYASAEAFKEAFDPNTKEKWEFGEGVKGFWSGLQGKEKTTFKDVLKQHGNTGKGMGTLGFALDVAADPLTWTGLGAVAKAGVKSGQAIKQLDEIGKVQSELVRKGADETQVREAMNTAAAPAQAIKKKHLSRLSTEGRQVYEYAIDARGADNSRAVEKVVSGWKRHVKNASHVDLRAFSDDKLREVAVATIREEEKAHPGLTHILRRVRASKNTMHHSDGAQAPADSYASYERFKAGHIDGTIRMHPNKSGNREYMSRYKDSGGHISVKVDTPEAALKYMTVHEIGHQVAQAMTDDAKDALLNVVKKKHGDDYADELSEYGTKNVEEMTAEAWAEFRLMGDKARPLAKTVAEEMIKHAPKTVSKSETQSILKQLADDAIEADVKNIDEWADAEFTRRTGYSEELIDTNYSDFADEIEALKAEKLAERGITDVKAAKKAMEEQLIALTARNIDPKIKKQFAIKVGPTAVGIPKSYDAVMKSASAVASIPGIKQSVDKFNSMFRANAHIPSGLNHLRGKSQGSAMFLVTQHIKVLQSIFNKVPGPARASVLRALRDGATEGNAIKGGLDINGQPVNDLVGYVRNELQALDISRLNSDVSLDEINAFLGNKYKITEPSVQKGYKVVEATNAQGQKYQKKVYTNETSPNPTAMFDALLKNSKIKDPAQALYLYSAALNQAIAKRNMYETVAQTWGVPKGDLANKLVKDHGWVEVKDIPNTEGFLFPSDVARGIEQVNKVFSDARSTGQFIDQYDRALQGFKSVVTRYNPSFHSRTFLGEMLLGYMGGMKNIPRSYNKARLVISGRNGQFYGSPAGSAEAFGEDASKRLIQASNAMRGVVPQGTEGGRVIINHKVLGQLTADKVWSLYMETGLKSGYSATDLVRGTEISAAKFAKTRDVMQSFTEGVEDYGRLAHFIDALQHTKAKSLDEAVNEAGQVVRKFHLDYTNVTGFEKNVMTRAMPFYKWMRLSTPVMAEILLTQPGKALALPKAMREISDMAGYDTEQFGPFPGGADAVVPNWLREHGAVPIGEFGGNTNYFDPTAIFPLGGSLEAAQGGALNMLTPAFKIPAEIYMGKDKYGNQLTGENANANERKNYALAQTPQSNFANQMITKRDPGIPRTQTLLQFLANPGIQPNTDKRMQGEAFRQRQEAYSHRKRLKKEQGLIP